MITPKRICVNTPPLNPNLVEVEVNDHEQMGAYPIVLTAGCSWACLDVETAQELIKALVAAIGMVEAP